MQRSYCLAIYFHIQENNNQFFHFEYPHSSGIYLSFSDRVNLELIKFFRVTICKLATFGVLCNTAFSLMQ